MSNDHSITRLLPGVKCADNTAATALFARCYSRVCEIARGRLRRGGHRAFDEDDVAQSAFCNFLKRAANGEFARLENRDDVWQILTMRVVDSITDRLRRERAKKRGGGMPDVTIDEVQQAICDLDDPALEAEIADAKAVFVSKLPSDGLRCVVELRAQGLSHEEIAKSLNVSVSTVGYRLAEIYAAVPRILGLPDPRTKSRRHWSATQERRNEPGD